MPRTDIRCPHCGRVNWANAPRLREIVAIVKRRKHGTTSADLVELLDGLTVQGASNALARLASLGLASRTSECMPTGGFVFRYQIIEGPDT